MDLDAVLFDFAGTLLVPGPATELLAQVTGDPDPDLAARLDRAGRPGGPEPETMPDGLAEDYARRDTSLELHRKVYVALLSQVVDPQTAHRLYDADVRADSWQPYPDAAPVLKALHEQGIGIAVVSNVGFDLPAVFVGNGLDGYVDAYVLSYELGVMKPDARLFQVALDRLGVRPDRALMVGDNPRADNGAVDLGIPTLLLPFSPAGRAHGLQAVLRLL